MWVVALENTSEGKFTQLVANHVLGHVYRQKILSVVHGEVETDEFRRNVRPPRPCFDRLAIISLLCLENLLH